MKTTLLAAALALPFAAGAAFAAGLTVGVWKSTQELAELWAVQHMFTPQMEAATRAGYFAEWKKAVSKSLGWVEENIPKSDSSSEDKVKSLLRQVTATDTWSQEVTWAVLVGSLVVGFLAGRSTRRS